MRSTPPRDAGRGTDDRRAVILRAALASFAAHGFERASIRDIATRVGMTHAGLLNRFASKDELLRQALDQHHQDMTERAGLIAAQGTDGIGVAVGVFIESLADREMARGWLALKVAATAPDHPAHDFFAARQQEAAAAVTRAARTTPPRAGLDPREAGALLLALRDGLALQWLMNPELRVESAFEQATRLLFSAAVEDPAS